MTYELGRYLDVPWESVTPDYDIKPSEYYFIRSLKSISDLELFWELQRLGLKDIPEYEVESAKAVWRSVEEVGDKPHYVMVKVSPLTEGYWQVETWVQAQHLGKTPITLLIPMIKDLLIALGFLLIAITLTTLVFTAVFRGKPPEILPKEVWYSVILASVALTTYLIYRIFRK